MRQLHVTVVAADVDLVGNSSSCCRWRVWKPEE